MSKICNWKVIHLIYEQNIVLLFVFIIIVHVYQVINSLSPVCSYAIRKIPMDGCRITFSLRLHVIQHPSIGISPYCVNKQGITNNIYHPNDQFHVLFIDCSYRAHPDVRLLYQAFKRHRRLLKQKVSKCIVHRYNSSVQVSTVYTAVLPF